jgi:hypothetical protein
MRRVSNFEIASARVAGSTEPLLAAGGCEGVRDFMAGIFALPLEEGGGIDMAGRCSQDAVYSSRMQCCEM